MKKGKFKYIVLILLLIIYAIAMFLAFGVDEMKEREASTTIVVGSGVVWNYSSRSWLNYNTPELLNKVNWNKFNVYVDNEKLGNYYIWIDDKTYLFDDNREAVNYQGNLFAYSADYLIDIIPFSVENIEDYTYVNQVLDKYNITDRQFTLANVSSIDFDQDGALEDFYIVSNVFAMDFFPDKYFSYVFMVDDEKIYMLYEDSDTNTGVNGCKPALYTVGDFDYDKDNELILSCNKYSNQTPVFMLYEFQNDAFRIEISN